MHEPAQKCENNSIFQEKILSKTVCCFLMVYFSYLSLGEKL